MGISEAFYIPAALALIADFHLGPTRSRAIGLHQMGIYAGVIIGGFSGYAADSASLGWRWAFNACGIVGLLYAIPVFMFLRNPARREGYSGESHTSPGRAVRDLLGNSSFILLVLYFTLPALAGADGVANVPVEVPPGERFAYDRGRPLDDCSAQAGQAD